MPKKESLWNRLRIQLGGIEFLLVPGVYPASPRYQGLERKVPAYTLPDPLVTRDGARVVTPEAWAKQRRPELLELFQTNVYGKSPPAPRSVQFDVVSIDEHARGGLATRKEFAVSLTGTEGGPTVLLLMYLPNAAIQQGRRVKTFIGLNFWGNHTIDADKNITITKSWLPDNVELKGRSPEQVRGIRASRWPIDLILERGFGMATAYYGDIVPDRKDGLSSGITSRYYKDGQERPAPDEWGAIGAWAWGLSRCLDCLEQDHHVDGKHVFVIGHSRLGKTALWAGAQDERFAMVISNDSGCGGAALSMRHFGETVAKINIAFPHWFCDNFKRYNENEAALPVDQHELVALIAPRPVYVASAQKDIWADPKGEFLSALAADPVYKLLGTEGLPATEIPAANQPVMGRIGYHMRSGRHDLTEYDWTQYITFARKHFPEVE